MPVAQREVVKAGTRRAVGRDDPGCAFLAREIGDRAVAQPDPPGAVRGGRRHGLGQVAAGAALVQGAGRNPMARRNLERRIIRDDAQIGRAVGRDPLPQFGRGKAVVVAGQQDPGQVCRVGHCPQGLPQRVGGGGFGVEGVACQQHHSAAAATGRNGKPADGTVARLAQPVADAFG